MDAELSFDLSLCVNIHAGSPYLRRSLMSLAEAARFARGYGLRTEIVIVLDRSPAATVALAEGYDYGAFDGHQIAHVDNGSLGLSRNDGLALARGDIVAFCDEDDLISYNTVVEFYNLAKSAGPDTIVQAEYYLCFSQANFIYRYFDSDVISPLSFITSHPYTSHICVHRSLGKRLRFQDVRLSPGYAYEDWHFNAQALAAGLSFRAAPNTLVYYRKRSSGLLRSMDSLSVRQAPPSLLFEPPTYLRVCAKSFRDFETNGAPTSPSPTLVRDFLANPVLLELTKSANAIEPAIDLVAMEHGPAGSNLDADLRRGAAYYRACKLIGADRFTDVVLLPFVTRGGGERYISNVLNSIADLDPDSRFLVLGGQWLDQHDWLDQLPRNATFIDLPRLGDKLSPDDIDVLTLRLIEATAPTARVHLKTSAYAHSFFQRYGRLLACNRFIYYRFSDPAVELDGQYFVRGDAFDFLSENGDALDRVISDHQQIVLHDRARLEPAGSKWTALYTRRDPLITREAIEARGSHFTRKLLWAARLDKEKRPELLLKIARALEEYLPEVSIDVFGSPVMNAFDVGRFASHPNIHYRGSYDSFSGLDHQGYDALLYTSLYDGLPNVVLEALAAGLPVIAPDLGGIGEAVATGSTGFLIPRGGADAELVSLYANAVSYLYQHPELFVGMRLNALQAVLDRHAAAAFEKKLAEILEQLATDRDRG